MSKLTDSELIEELIKRFDEKNRALFDLNALTKKLEEVNKKLQESEALKGHFLSNIRNEINNPLTSISCLSNELKSGKIADPATSSLLASSIYFEVFNLNFQLKNILTAAEMEAGEMVVSFSKVNITKLIQSVIDSFQHLAEAQRLTIKFSWEKEDENPGFKTDSEMIQMIISNLLSNAIKYSLEKGQIEVKGLIEGGYLNLQVKDSGIGIKESQHQIIFERFKQLESGTTKRFGGHGLGLSVVKALVELLNGTMSLASSPDTGSAFTLLIPEADCCEESDIFSEEGNDFIFESFEADEERF